MTEPDWLVAGFEQNRARLRGVAYRMLGSLAEADDAVQETWLRLNRSDAGDIGNLAGWLTTVLARVCLNMLRSRTTRREQSLDAHVPDPIISRADGTNPEDEALLADSVGLALQVVLETLAPAERLAFVLHDMFGLPFDEIAPMVGRSPAAARQLASRARRRVRGAGVQASGSDVARQREIVDAFFAAAHRGTSTRSSLSSTQTSWRASTGERPNGTLPGCSAARRPSPARRSRWRCRPRLSGQSW